VDEKIRMILTKHGRLPLDAHSLEEDDDLYRIGLTSHASVNVMLAIEEEFNVEFPEQMLRKSTFQSIAAIRSAIVGLTAGNDA